MGIIHFEVQTMKKRETELDILRIVALLAVILVHICGGPVDTLPPTTSDWKIMVLRRGLVTWEVPVYVMISGRFFLDPKRDITFTKIRKSISRLLLAFLVWDIVYAGYYFFSGAYIGLNWKGILSQAIIGPYHFWYLHMLILVYAITPFLRKISQDKKLMEYFIVLFLIFQFITEYGPQLPFVGSIIEQWLGIANYYFTLGYSGYYILGYYLCKHKLSTKLEIPLYIVSACLLAASALTNLNASLSAGYEVVQYTQYMRPNIIIVTMAVYTFGVKRLSQLSLSDKAVKIISSLSEHSFGVYLIHALVIECFALLGMTPNLIHPLLMIPIYTILVYLTSHFLILIIRKIPCIGRKIT